MLYHHVITYAFCYSLHSTSIKNVIIIIFDIKDTIILVSLCLHYDINTQNYVVPSGQNKCLHCYGEKKLVNFYCDTSSHTHH